MSNPTRQLALALFFSLLPSGYAIAEPSVPNPAQPPSSANRVGPYETNEVDAAPKLRVPVNPQYPSKLKRAGITGEAVVRFTVRANGTVSNATVLSATNPQFGEAAKEAILKWKFKPATLKGQAVDCQATQTLKFSVGR